MKTLNLAPAFFLISFLFSSVFQTSSVSAQSTTNKDPIRIGWIGAMTGPMTKFGSYQAAQLAEEDLNKGGGVNGRPVKLVFEDGQCNGKSAVTALEHLVSAEKLHFILGGHCSPESAAIAPLAKRQGVVLLASSTTTPVVSVPDDNFFRLSPVNTKGAEILAPLAVQKMKLLKFTVLHAETDYAAPPAKHFAELVKSMGGTVTEVVSYNEGETDFRSILLRFKQKQVDAIYIGVQAPDSATVILRQLNDINFHPQLFGNEVAGTGGFSNAGELKKLYEGMIFAEPNFDVDAQKTKEFIDRFKAKYSVPNLPFGIWTAEAYDAVVVMANTISRCGDDVSAVAKCLQNSTDLNGVSGDVSIDKNGDGVRKYVLKKIVNQVVVPLT